MYLYVNTLKNLKTQLAEEQNRQKVIDLANRADEFYNKKDYAGAEEAYREAIKLNPNSSALRKALVVALFQHKHWAEAEEESRKAIDFNPNNAIPRILLGSSLWVQGRFTEGETELRKAMELDPDYAVEARDALSGLLTDKGNNLYRQGKTSEAEAAFREAISLKPYSPEASQGLALIEQKQQERKRVNNIINNLASDFNPSNTPGSSASPSNPQGRPDFIAPGGITAFPQANQNSNMTGLDLMDPNTPTVHSATSNPKTFTLIVHGQRVTFISPDNPKTGHIISPSAQAQSATSSGKKAVDAANQATFGEEDLDLPGNLSRAKDRSGLGFDTPGEQANSLAPVVLKDISPAERLQIPPEVLTKVSEDGNFKELLKQQSKLLESQQKLDERLKDVEQKRVNIDNPNEKGALEIEEAKIKQERSTIPGQIRITEIEMGKIIERYVDRSLHPWPGQEKTPEQNQPAESQPPVENEGKKWWEK